MIIHNYIILIIKIIEFDNESKTKIINFIAIQIEIIKLIFIIYQVYCNNDK
jgi:hypothetical protein